LALSLAEPNISAAAKRLSICEGAIRGVDSGGGVKVGVSTSLGDPTVVYVGLQYEQDDNDKGGACGFSFVVDVDASKVLSFADNMLAFYNFDSFM
jgi:hypothetical protein